MTPGYKEQTIDLVCAFIWDSLRLLEITLPKTRIPLSGGQVRAGFGASRGERGGAAYGGYRTDVVPVAVHLTETPCVD